MKSKRSFLMVPKIEAQNQSQFLDTIAAHLFTLLKIIIFALLLLAIIFIFIKIYTQQGIVILPFEIKNENLSGIAIADQITSELLRIQQIHSTKYNAKNAKNAKNLRGSQTKFYARVSADLSPSDLSPIIPKTESMKFSMADTGTISTGYGSLDPGKLIIAFKNICPASKPDTTIRGSLQRYGSNIALVAVLEGNNVQSWMVRERVDNDNEDQLHEMILNLTFKIAHELSQPDVSAKTWEGLKYYTEALDSYNQYNLTGNPDAIYRASNYSLKAISSEKGYRKPYDLLRTLEFEYVSIGKQGNALEICNKTIKLDPSSEYGWENKANVLHVLNMTVEAVQEYNNATTINPQYAEAWNDKGSALKELAKYEEAIKAYNESIRIDPNYSKAWNNKGLALQALNKNDEAINAYEEAIGIDPNNAFAWNNKGSALKSQGKHDEAIEAYDEAIRLDPNYADPWNNKGIELKADGNTVAAIEAYDEAIRIDPNDAFAWNNKGSALKSQGKYDEAIEAYDEAIRLDPSYANFWNNKGVALQAQGNNNDAIKAFDTAIGLDSKHVKAWINKGIALKSLGRTSEADAASFKAKELGYAG